MTPELLRAKGELLAQAADQFGAEHYFRESMALADQHAAKSWRLRTAASFARTHNGQGSRKEARSVLEWTYAQFDEGYGTVDLKRAKRLLEGLGNELSC